MSNLKTCYYVQQIFLTGTSVKKYTFIRFQCMDTIYVTSTFSLHSHNKDIVDRTVKVINLCDLPSNTNNTSREIFAGELKFNTVENVTR
jgi:hypothetical protein